MQKLKYLWFYRPPTYLLRILRSFPTCQSAFPPPLKLLCTKLEKCAKTSTDLRKVTIQFTDTFVWWSASLEPLPTCSTSLFSPGRKWTALPSTEFSQVSQHVTHMIYDPAKKKSFQQMRKGLFKGLEKMGHKKAFCTCKHLFWVDIFLKTYFRQLLPGNDCLLGVNDFLQEVHIIKIVRVKSCCFLARNYWILDVLGLWACCFSTWKCILLYWYKTFFKNKSKLHKKFFNISFVDM